MSETSRRRPPQPAIIIDTREQQPYAFAGFNTIVRGLKTGDYSLDGHTDRVAVERKSTEDAYGVIGAGRERFEREVQRLSVFVAPAIVIEGDLADFADPPQYTRITAAQAVGSFISWGTHYRIPVWFCHGRREAERVTVRILAAYLKHLSGDQHE